MAHGYTKTRTIRGKKYNLWDLYRTKKAALNYASRVRATGGTKASVVKDRWEEYYAVYVRLDLE